MLCPQIQAHTRTRTLAHKLALQLLVLLLHLQKLLALLDVAARLRHSSLRCNVAQHSVNSAAATDSSVVTERFQMPGKAQLLQIAQEVLVVFVRFTDFRQFAHES